MTLADRTTWTEWAVRYTAPAKFAGTVAGIRETRGIAEGYARQCAGLGCTVEVVQRTVTAGEWEVAG